MSMGRVPPRSLDHLATSHGRFLRVGRSDYFSLVQARDRLVHPLGSPWAGYGRLRVALRVAAVLPLAILLAWLSAQCATAQQPEDANRDGLSVAARVLARHVDDDRTEFGLQFRGLDGLWNELQFPRERFLSADAMTNRWTYSSTLILGLVDIRLRVAVRRHSSGAIEFAIQRLEPDNVWSERRLPRGRVLPRDTPIGRRLASSTVSFLIASDGPPSPDRATLVALYEAWGGERWNNNKNWLSSLPVRYWYGVTTNADNRVVGLGLNANGIVGTIPAEIGLLTKLTRINLRGGGYGTSSESKSGCVGFLTGTFADQLEALSQLPNLKKVDLSCNQFSGPIPADLTPMTHLEQLNLSENRGTGLISSQLGAFSNLQVLNLSYNEFSGAIPAELGNLHDLRDLDLSFNNLSGPIPGTLGSLLSLQTLRLSYNQLAGPLPAELGSLENLRLLQFSHNRIDGPIPSAWGGLKSLRSMELYSNRITDPLPDSLGELVSLKTLNLEDNRISGVIPVSIVQLRNLSTLNLRHNNLRGNIPPELGQLSRLTYLLLGENELSGQIPPELGSLNRLSALVLSNNRLEGPIPGALGNLVNLHSISLSGNTLSGSIPTSLGNLAALLQLYLGSNELTGNIPTEFGRLSRIGNT